MRLTDRTDYALRVLMVLCVSGRRHTVPALASRFGVSAHHLTKVVQSLQGLGWVETTAGRAGGAALAPAGRTVTVGEVVRAMEPDLDLVACMREAGTCPLKGLCPLEDVLRAARAAFLRELDAVRLCDLVDGRGDGLLGPVSAALLVNGVSR